MSDDIELDDFGELDDFDMDPFGGEAEGGNNNRTPVTEAKSSFANAVMNDLVSVQAASKIARKGLPDGYSKAMDTVGEMVYDAQDIYDKAEKKLEPAISKAKDVVNQALPKAKGILPDGMYKAIEEATSPEGGSSNTPNPDEMAITSALSDIFTVQAEQDERGRQEQAAQDTIRDRVTEKRFEKSTNQMAMVQESLSRMVGYQDTITANYQKKSLELQFRHYFAARDLLQLQQASNTDIITALNDIKTNTGLPDWVKTEQSENFQEMLQQRLMGGTVESVGDFMSGYMNRLKEGIANQVVQYADDAAQAIDTVSDLAAMGMSMSEMSGDDQPFNATNFVAGAGGGIAGSALSNWIVDRAGKALKEEAGAEKWVVENGLKAKNFVDSMPGWVKEQLDTADDDQSMFGGLRRWLADVAPDMNTTTRIQNNLESDAAKAAQWDILSRRTLVEIIPGLLSRIGQNTEIMATGNKDVERMVYSSKSEGFVRESEATAEVANALIDRTKIKEYRSKSDEFMDKLFKGYPLSNEARATFSEQMERDASKGWEFNPKRYLDVGGFESHFNPQATGELVEFFRKKYHAKEEGEGEDRQWTMRDTEQNLKLTGELQHRFRDIRNMTPQMQEEINKVVMTGNKELLRNTGWVSNVGGKDEYNEARMRDLLNGRLTLDDLEIESQVASLKAERKEAQEAFQRPEHLDVSPIPKYLDPNAQNAAQEVQSGVNFKDFMQPAFNGASEELTAVRTAVERSTDRTGEVAGNTLSLYEIAVEQRDVVTEIRDLMVTNTLNQFSSEDAVLGQELLKKFTALSNWSQPAWYDTLASGVTGAVKATGSAIGGFYGGVFDGAKWLAGKASDAGTAVWDFVNKRADVLDIYIKGRRTPVLQANLLGTGRYVDELTGKAIRTLEDITGPVRDLETDSLVISWEDFENGLFASDGSSVLDKLTSLGKNAITKGADLIGGYYGFLGNTASTSFNYVKDKLVAYDRDLKNQCDVYVRSRMEDGAQLLRSKLRRGEYHDIDGNPIYSVADITGPVYDENNLVRITDEDISDGLVDQNGNEIVVNGIFGNAKGIAGMGLNLALKTGKGALDALRGYYGGITEAGASLMERLKNGIQLGSFETIQNMSVTAKNVYINGQVIDSEESPVEAATSAAKAETVAGATKSEPKEEAKAEEQKYDAPIDFKTTFTQFQEAAETAKDTIREKTSEKVAEYGEMIPTAIKEFDIRDQIGRAQEAFSKREPEERDMMLGDDTVIQVDSQGSAQIVSRDGLEVDVGDGTERGMLAAMTAFLARMAPESKGGDTDGDGFRDGGWRQQLFGEKDEENPNMVDKAKERVSGMFDGLGGKAKGLLGLLGLGGGGGDGDEGGITDFLTGAAEDAVGESIADRLGGKDNDAPDRGGNNRTKTRGGKKGLWSKLKGGVSNLTSKAKTLGGKALSLGGTGAGGTAARLAARQGLKKGALAVLGGIATTLGSPIIGTAIAAASAAYTGYEIFKFAARRTAVEPLEAYRFHQYGIDPENMDQVIQIRYLEEEIADKATISGRGVAHIENSGDDALEAANDYAEDFGVDLEDVEQTKAWVDWYSRRFVPVLSLHLSAAHKYGRVDLLDVDDEIEDADLPNFVKQAYFEPSTPWPGGVPYTLGASPFPEFQLRTGYEWINASKKALLDGAKEDKKAPTVSDYAKGTLTAAAVTGSAAYAYGAMDKKPTTPSKPSDTTSKSNTADALKRATKPSAYLTGAYGGAAAYSYVTPKPTQARDSKKQALTTVVEETPTIESLDALTLLRYRLYGTYKPTLSDVVAYRKLEEKIFEDTTITRGKAKWEGVSDYYFVDGLAPFFGYSTEDPEGLERWIEWVDKRVVPVFSTYLVELNRAGKLDSWQHPVGLDDMSLKNTVWRLTTARHGRRDINKMGAAVYGFAGKTADASYQDIWDLARKLRESTPEEALKEDFIRVKPSRTETPSVRTTTQTKDSTETATEQQRAAVNSPYSSSAQATKTEPPKVNQLDVPKFSEGPEAAGVPVNYTPSLGRQKLIEAMDKAGITNDTERRMFMTQMAHESMDYKRLVEMASGSAYEGRRSLGNTEPGDGMRYKGRGFIQLTGRSNYDIYGNKLGVDLEDNPEFAADPDVAAAVAVSYWDSRVNRAAAQQGDVVTVTKNINGGTNGLRDRMRRFARTKPGEFGGPTEEATTNSFSGTTQPLKDLIPESKPEQTLKPEQIPTEETVVKAEVKPTAPATMKPTMAVAPEPVPLEEEKPKPVTPVTKGAATTIRPQVANYVQPVEEKTAPVRQDPMVVQQQRIVSQAKVAEETRSGEQQVTNAILQESLTVQRRMEQHLKDISKAVHEQAGKETPKVEPTPEPTTAQNQQLTSMKASDLMGLGNKGKSTKSYPVSMGRQA